MNITHGKPAYLDIHTMIKDVNTLEWIPAVGKDTVAAEVEITNTSVPVTGVFFPDIQPVSGSVAITNEAIPVTGTFYPATQPISATSLPLPTGAASFADQEILNSLIDTLHELISRFNVIASWASSGQPGMRVVGVSMPSTAVTGPITSAQAAQENMRNNNILVTLANINNCTGA